MKRFRFFGVLAVLVLILGMLPVAALPVSADDGGQGQEVTRDVLYMPGEVIVGFAEGMSAKQSAAQAAALAGEVGA